MKNFSRIILTLSLFLIAFPSTSFAKFAAQSEDFGIRFFGMFKPEMFYGKNVSLLNDNNPGNQIWFMRSTLDLGFEVNYGYLSYGSPVITSVFDIRNKGIWGNPQSIAFTDEAFTGPADAIGRKHRHSIPRFIFWMREAWIDFALHEFMGLSFMNEHTFKLGLFSFELGRGIALGDAYAMGPELLGYYNETAVDQFAPGAVLHGVLVDKILSYDLYTAILNDRATNLAETNAPIYAQEYGHLLTPQRGSGKINFIIAGRLGCDPFDHPKFGKLHIEPYALFNHDPEQKVEFLGDATSQLGTVGMAVEYAHPRFEFGFDYALNLGQQRVKGWDRNHIAERNYNGQVVVVNSHVVDAATGANIPFVPASEAQNIITTSFRSETENGQSIGTVASAGYLTGPIALQNARARFRDPYTNKYEGWMFIADGGIWVYKKDLKLTAMAAITTGDENPNNESKDSVYSGFIPLQEVYSGSRVRSAFLLGGAGRLNRPLSQSNSIQAPSKFAQVVNGFTNLVLVGTGLHWKPQDWEKQFSLNPNGIAYWQEKATKRFNAFTGKELDTPASTYLGVELNLFMHYMVMKDLKLYLIGSIFFPGTHYRDILGKPLNSEQKLALESLDRTNFDINHVPNIGDDIAYTYNLGIEFRF